MKFLWTCLFLVLGYFAFPYIFFFVYMGLKQL